MTLTSHGHHIPGTLDTDEPAPGHYAIGRCGGVRLCSVCMHEASRIGTRDVFSEGTMKKVFDAIVSTGRTHDEALDTISAMQNVGVLFREHWMYEVSPYCTRCTEKHRRHKNGMHTTEEHDIWWKTVLNSDG